MAGVLSVRSWELVRWYARLGWRERAEILGADEACLVRARYLNGEPIADEELAAELKMDIDSVPDVRMRAVRKIARARQRAQRARAA